MLRIPAVLLAVVISFLLIAPGSYLAANTQLPACCRTHGAHRCAMSTSSSDSASAGLAVRALCRFTNHHPVSSAGINRVTLPATAAGIFAELLSHTAAIPQVEANFRISWLRSCQKRGPPALLS